MSAEQAVLPVLAADGKELLYVLDRAEVVVASRVGAGRPLREAFHAARWAQALARVGVLDGARLAQQVLDALHVCVEPYTTPRDRVQGVRDGFTMARQSLAHWLTAQSCGTHVVYRLYNALGALLYVGLTSRGPHRLAQHYDDKAWFHMVARVEFETFDTREQAAAHEVRLIKRLRPVFNVVHNRSRW